MPNDRPNLLYVFADQMRGMDMGCAGNPDVQTPAMDRLAAEGAMFSRAYSNCPVCTPSRAMLLSGQYPLTCRTVANDLPLPTGIKSFGTLCRDAGYHTGYVGKWHLDGVPRSGFTPPGPRRHGFDFWAVWNCAHDYFHGRVFRDTDEVIDLPGYEPDAQTDIALEFLDGCGEDPFCLFVSWGPPHNPYDQVPQEYRSMYDPEAITLRPNFRDILPGEGLYRGEDARRSLCDYYAHISALDANLGRLLDSLDQRGLADNTIVVFSSDHGDMLWSQGMLRKQQPWEESIRIPFLVRRPGQIPAGHRPQTLLSVADQGPSLLSLMEVEAPAAMEGADLSPAMLGQSDEGPSSVFIMDVITLDEAYAQGLRAWRGVRTARHTYARFIDGEPWVLYDNEQDPYQERNLIADPASAELREEMEAELQGWLERTGDTCQPWEEVVRELDLVELWNARERELHPRDPRLL